MHRGDAQVRGDIVLRYALQNVRLFAQQIQVTLLRRIADKGHKLAHIMQLPFKNDVYQLPQEGIIGIQVFHHQFIILLFQHVDNGWFNSFQSKYARGVFSEAIRRRYHLVFKYELAGSIPPVVIEPNTDTAFLDKERAFGYLALAQQDGFSRHLHALIQTGVFFQFILQVWHALYQLLEHEKAIYQKAQILVEGITLQHQSFIQSFYKNDR